MCDVCGGACSHELCVGPEIIAELCLVHLAALTAHIRQLNLEPEQEDVARRIKDSVKTQAPAPAAVWVESHEWNRFGRTRFLLLSASQDVARRIKDSVKTQLVTQPGPHLSHHRNGRGRTH